MMTQFTREYYKIRFKDNVGKYNEWHYSNNGTCEWSTLSKIKSVITRGIRVGYKGRNRIEFENYEIVKITEVVDITEEIVTLD